MLLEMRDVTKSFGATRALEGVSLGVESGEVRALIGENGAGKSTLMKILAGAYRPDSGSMSLAGEVYAPRGPREARARGVAMIYQELALAPDLTVEANVMLGQERVRAGVIRRQEHRKLVADALSASRSPRHPSRGQGRRPGRGSAAIGRGGSGTCLECPSHRLRRADQFPFGTRLPATFLDCGTAKGPGACHRLYQPFPRRRRQVAQTFTILRDGRGVAAGRMDATDLQSIIAHMVGRNLDELFPRVPHEPGEPILAIEELRSRKTAKPANLTVRRGEILGIAGLVGAGRTTLVRAVFGLGPVISGKVRVGHYVGGYAAPPVRITQGVGFSSEDRKTEGLALSRSIEDNLTYSALSRHARWGWLKLRERRVEVSQWIARMRISASGPRQSCASLSGGNQQKVALARLLHQRADILLLDEPTRGIDVGSKAEIYRLIGEQAALGKAILVVSSYLPELFGICDRIAVMSRGALCVARPVSEWTEHEVMDVATRADSGQSQIIG